MKRSDTNSSEELTEEEIETLKSLLNYPSLERFFGSTDARSQPALKQKMQSTVDDLERVIRHGSREDAAKAAKTAEAYRTALTFLDELIARRPAK